MTKNALISIIIALMIFSIPGDASAMSGYSAKAGLVLDPVSGLVLVDINGYEELAMASTTKVMTAILAIELGNLDDEVTVSSYAASTTGSSMALSTGQKLTLNDLLYGLMLRSGNDAAVAIAEHIGGSEAEFVYLMNKKAKELGLEQTQYLDPHGLGGLGHYTTAYDLALLTAYAMEISLFREVVEAREYTYMVNGEEVTLYNINRFLSSYEGATGVKTGYTSAAGQCITASAKRDGWELIGVVLGSAYGELVKDATLLLDYAYASYDLVRVVRKESWQDTLVILDGEEDSVMVGLWEDVWLPVSTGDNSQKYHQEIIWYYEDEISAPVPAGLVVGQLVVYNEDGQKVGSTFIYVMDTVLEKPKIEIPWWWVLLGVYAPWRIYVQVQRRKEHNFSIKW